MGKRWTDADIRKLPAGMAPALPAAAAPAPQKPAPRSMEEPKQLRQIKAWLGMLKIEFVTEHVFHPTRKWRFDVAIPEAMVAIEYEGVFSEKSRHTTLAGYTADVTKYNEAQKLGWRVLRYTAKNYEDFLNDITTLINPAGE